ncbi:hypothetical protein [Calditerrivibrio sp.]|uniref:hypothetical protein n=1 Tax=Calditerrivibrio sp. TaxID=2792612 RepID=UPI003D0E7D2C
MKRTTFVKNFFYLFFVLLASNIAFAEIDSYYVGLKAYQDGFYDVSLINLEDFLKTDNASKEAIFAKYLLYKIYLKQNNIQKAKEYFQMIKDLNDDRFDNKSMSFDEVYLTAIDNCSKAYAIIDQKKDYSLNKALIGTKCAIDNSTNIDIQELPDSLKFSYIMQINDKALIKKTFEMLNLKNLTNEQIKQLSIKLYKYELITEFWKAYETYRDKDTINLAIERVWKVGKYEDVIKGYNYNRQHALLPETYCMVLDAHFKTNKKVNYSIIEKCFTAKDEKYYKALIRAYSVNNDIPMLKNLINSLPDNQSNILCELGSSVITANLLDKKNYKRLINCENIDNISNDLLQQGLTFHLIQIHFGMENQKSYYYLAYAYGLEGKKKLLKKYYDKITVKDLKNNIYKRFKRYLK